jgi:hypothetical protein
MKLLTDIRSTQSIAILLVLMGGAPIVSAEIDTTAETDRPANAQPLAKKGRGSPSAPEKSQEKATADHKKNKGSSSLAAKTSEATPKGEPTAKDKAPASPPTKKPASAAAAPAIPAKSGSTPVAQDLSKDIASLRREIAELKAAQDAMLGPAPALAQPSLPPEVQEHLAALQKERKEIETKLGRLDAAVSSGVVERDTVAASFEALRSRLASISAEIDQANKSAPPPSPRPNVLQRLDVIESRVSGLTTTAPAAAASQPAASSAVAPPSPPPSAAVQPTVATVTSQPSQSAPASAPSFKIEGGEGSSLKVGLLLQPQYQLAGDLAKDGYSQNLYIKRTRVLLGGTLLGMVDYFLETDFPNLFTTNNVAGADGAAYTAAKNTPGMNIQDAFATFRFWKDMVKVDAGYTLPSLAHNALQSAATLYSWDYFGYSFQHSASFPATSNPIGRDLGVQLRGLLWNGLVEYRAGLFQGVRKPQTTSQVSAKNFFRFASRVQVNLLDAETGYFYQGTYLGKKKILSFGAAVDVQDEYKYFAGDGFVDMPVGPAGVVTGQVNIAHWNGGTLIPGLAKQTAVMGEAGFYFSALKISPITKIEFLSGSGTVADEYRISGGIAYWPYSHNCNLKAFFTRIHRDGAVHALNQFNLQWQVFAF